MGAISFTATLRKRWPAAAVVARWIAEAKKEETREHRVGQVLEMLHEGRTRS